MRLVDADTLKKRIKESTADKSVKVLAEVLVNTAPTVEAVPVVRCRDCKFRNTIICPMVHETIGNGTTDYATDDGYCNRGSGKRKDGSEC